MMAIKRPKPLNTHRDFSTATFMLFDNKPKVQQISRNPFGRVNLSNIFGKDQSIGTKPSEDGTVES